MNDNIKNTIRYLAFTIVVAIVVFSFMGIANGESIGSASETVYVKNTVSTNGEVQKATLSMQNWVYEIDKPLKTGIPVELEVDLSTVSGCMKDVVISEFGVRKYVKEGDNVITFTPDKSGTFNVACSMNMGRGTFVVEEADGKISDYVETIVAAAPAGGSCGASTGGSCGCGA